MLIYSFITPHHRAKYCSLHLHYISMTAKVKSEDLNFHLKHTQSSSTSQN